MIKTDEEKKVPVETLKFTLGKQNKNMKTTDKDVNATQNEHNLLPTKTIKRWWKESPRWNPKTHTGIAKQDTEKQEKQDKNVYATQTNTRATQIHHHETNPKMTKKRQPSPNR